jgi:hypothetical protein
MKGLVVILTGRCFAIATVFAGLIIPAHASKWCDGHSPVERAACRVALGERWDAARKKETNADAELKDSESDYGVAKRALADCKAGKRAAAPESSAEEPRAPAAGLRSAAKSTRVVASGGPAAGRPSATAPGPAATSKAECGAEALREQSEAAKIHASLKSARTERQVWEDEIRWQALRDAYVANHCAELLTFCVDRNGSLIAAGVPSDAPPDSVRVADKLTVVVLTATREADRRKVSVAFQGRATLEALFPPSLDIGAPAGNRAFSSYAAPSNSAEPPDVTYEPILFVSDPVADRTESLRVAFHRLPADDDPGGEAQWDIQVDRGYSYFSIALLVAATLNGERRVQRNLSVVTDTAVEPGLTLNIFPFGREIGTIGYVRHGGSVPRWIANNFGFQVGTDLDLKTPVDKLYAGVVFEPVAGLALVGGVTLRELAVVAPGGAVSPTIPMGDMSTSATRYAVRGYLGITLTLDLLKSISAAAGEIKQVKVP